MDNLERISEVNYCPSVEDVLHVRVPTTGVLETIIEMEKTPFRIVDVGGQRSERRKWMSCFEDVTAIIFIIAISEYDLTLNEDETTNRLHESFAVFQV